MDLVQDNQGTLLPIEKCVVRVWKGNKTINDGDMLVVYEKLAGVFERRKKKLPELPVFVSANQKQLFLDLNELCTGLVDSDNMNNVANIERLSELADGAHRLDTVSLHTMMLLLKRLCQSVKTFSKGKNRSDYFNNIEMYLP